MPDDLTMTLTTADGETTPPFTLDDLAAASKSADPLTKDVAEWVIERQAVSATAIRNHFAIGYERTKCIIADLELYGVITPADENGRREVASQDLPAALAITKAVKKSMGTPMKETAADREVKENTYRVAADELRQFIERMERLEAEKKDIAEQQKEVMVEAKSRGYDTKTIRKVIALRKRDPDDIAEEEALLETYKEVLGMS